MVHIEGLSKGERQHQLYRISVFNWFLTFTCYHMIWNSKHNQWVLKNCKRTEFEVYEDLDWDKQIRKANKH
jgi:hypothetical protein